MEEEYTAAVAEHETERSRELLAGLSPAGQRVATELMSIAHRAGRAAGRREASNAFLSFVA